MTALQPCSECRYAVPHAGMRGHFQCHFEPPTIVMVPVQRMPGAPQEMGFQSIRPVVSAKDSCGRGLPKAELPILSAVDVAAFADPPSLGEIGQMMQRASTAMPLNAEAERHTADASRIIHDECAAFEAKFDRVIIGPLTFEAFPGVLYEMFRAPGRPSEDGFGWRGKPAPDEATAISGLFSVLDQYRARNAEKRILIWRRLPVLERDSGGDGDGPGWFASARCVIVDAVPDDMEIHIDG